MQCLVTLTRQGLGVLHPHNTPTLPQRSMWKRSKEESEKYVDTDLVLLIYYCILNPKGAFVFGDTENFSCIACGRHTAPLALPES